MSISVTMRYEGKEYTFADTFEYTPWFHHDGTVARTPFEVAEYMYTEGNYGCDCNRSAFIHDECDESFAKMDCGRTIELVVLVEIKEQLQSILDNKRIDDGEVTLTIEAGK